MHHPCHDSAPQGRVTKALFINLSVLDIFQFYTVHALGPIHIQQGAVSIRKTVLLGMAIPMLKIRRPNGRLIFNMEIAIRR